MIRILTDSAADLTAAELNAPALPLLPMTRHLHGRKLAGG